MQVAVVLSAGGQRRIAKQLSQAQHPQQRWPNKGRQDWQDGCYPVLLVC
jgi:hypothetical protein